MMTKREAEAGVMAPVQEGRQLQPATLPLLKQLLLLEQARTDFTVPKRGKAQRREVEPTK